MPDNELYQYSLLDALMDGTTESGISPSHLLSHADHGLGTFTRLDGELILVGGVIYHLAAGGKVWKVEDTERIPFAMGTKFVPQKTSTISLKDKAELETILQGLTTNLFVTFQLRGRFKYLKCRTVTGQHFKGESLSVLGRRQHVAEYHDIEGVVIGYRCPKYWQGLGVAGNHFHFIDSDRTTGGHVLEISADNVEMQVAVASKLHIELPESEEFAKANIVTDDNEVKAVEG